jgi:hypothetical protein
MRHLGSLGDATSNQFPLGNARESGVSVVSTLAASPTSLGQITEVLDRETSFWDLEKLEMSYEPPVKLAHILL